MKSQKGITLIALTITMIVMVIIAGISTTMLTGDSGLVDESKNVVIQTELSELEEKMEEYIKEEQANRINNGEYSDTSVIDILEQNKITATIITTEGIRLGIIQNYEEIDFQNEKGKRGNEIVDGWIGSVTTLKDVFAINYDTKTYYYINDGEIWTKTGKIQIEEMMLNNLKQGSFSN